MTIPLRILVLSTPVGAIGSGVGGGVEVTLRGLVKGLTARGHHVEVVAPEGSESIGVVLHRVGGSAQPSMQLEDRGVEIHAALGSVLFNMWNFVAERHANFDVVLNLAYDVLPFRSAASLTRPVAHLVSMGSLNDVMDAAIDAALTAAPLSVAMHSREQASTYVNGDKATIVAGGIDVDECRFVDRPHPDGRVAFVGRISVEKGLHDVVRASALSARPLHVWGYLQDATQWDAATTNVPGADVTYRGFVAPNRLRDELGECAALVMAPKWVEAFGVVVLEALACGVPVVSYRRGGPVDIVVEGECGSLVEPDDVAALAAAIGGVGGLSRLACRRRAEEQYSTGAFAARVEHWLARLVGA